MTRILIADGTVRAVYSDRTRGLLERLAGRRLTPADAPRATSVEMDETGQWVARLPDGTVIARGTEREAVIRAEVEYLSKRLENL